MDTKKFPLRETFIEELKHHSGSEISEIYRHLFTCMEYETLEELLTYLKNESKHKFKKYG